MALKKGGVITSTQKIHIGEACDAFYITITRADGHESVFSFSNEETHEKLVEVFDAIGIPATYEEIY